MPGKKYTEEVKDFVREHIEGRSNKDLALLVNEIFGTDFTESKMKSFTSNYKIYRKKRAGYIKWNNRGYPREVKEFIEKHYIGVGPKEMTARLNQTFGSSYTHEQIKSYYHNHGLNSGLTGRFEKGNVPYTKGKTWEEYMSKEAQEKSRKTTFKKGNVPENELPLGTITKCRDGYLLIKVSMKGTLYERWSMLHRKVWEEHYGSIPKGMIVSFKDGNKENCDPENLMLITMGENAQLNTRGLRFENPELTQTGLLIAKVYEAVRERRKGCQK